MGRIATDAPPHVGGDAEYNGHGPSVSLHVELSVFNGNELWAAVSMDALETKSDWTRASSAVGPVLALAAHAGKGGETATRKEATRFCFMAPRPFLGGKR